MAENTAPELLKYLQGENRYTGSYSLVRVENLSDFNNFSPLVTGDVVDTLLFPSPQGMQNHFGNKGWKSCLVSRYGSYEGERLIGVVEDYSRLLKRPCRSDEDVIRLFSWSCLYYAHREAFYHMIDGDYWVLPFFDTQEFTDISYTSFWDSRLGTDNKKIFRDYMVDVFGEGVTEKIFCSRSFYPRISRKIRFSL